MDQIPYDAAVIKMMMEQMVRKGIPRALKIKDKVTRGELLNEFDLAFLGDVSTDLANIKPIADRNPEYQSVVLRMVQLFKEIADKALENELAGKDG